jgi:hypothetical protein
MPYVSRLFVRTAFIFLCLGVLLSFASFFRPNFYPVSIHAITLGWITNLIFGVAFWMFPRGKIKIQEKDFLTLSSFVMLNSGLFLRFISEPFLSFPILKYIFTISSFLQFLGCLFFVLHILRRIK